LANFPDSIYSPAAKSAGQTITAAFFNDPDGEITAIEQGFRNGTAPLNSSGSTVASLSVLGASTFASRPVTPPPPAVRVGITSTAVITASTAVNWVKQDYATNSSLHSTATNSSRLTPDSTGVWQISANVVWRVDGTASTGTNLVTQILDSSGTEIGLARMVSAMTATEHGHYVAATKRIDVVGTWFSINLSQAGGSSVSVSTQTSADLRKL
jgi:hypothetical protein